MERSTSNQINNMNEPQLINVQTLSEEQLYSIAGKIQSQVYICNTQLNVIYGELQRRLQQSVQPVQPVQPTPVADLPKLKKVINPPTSSAATTQLKEK